MKRSIEIDGLFGWPIYAAVVVSLAVGCAAFCAVTRLIGFMP